MEVVHRGAAVRGQGGLDGSREGGGHGLAGEVGVHVRRLAGEQLREGQGERVDIAARALLAAPVGHRAVHGVATGRAACTRRGVARGCELGPTTELGEAEIDDFDKDVTAGVPDEHQIGGLDVAVDHAGRVDLGERGRDLQADLKDHGGGQRPAAPQDADVEAVDVLGDEEARTLLGILAIDDAGDVLVRERGEHVGLAPEAVDGVDRQIGAHDLDGDARPEGRVVGLVDRRHTAAADLAVQLVAAGEQGAGVVGGLAGRRVVDGPPREFSRDRRRHDTSVPASAGHVNLNADGGQMPGSHYIVVACSQALPESSQIGSGATGVSSAR